MDADPRGAETPQEQTDVLEEDVCFSHEAAVG